MCDSLWGDEFKVPEKPKAKEIVKKIKKETLDASDEKQIKKIVKSKKVSLEEKLNLINAEVTRVLSKQKDNIICITDKDTFDDYINKCIQNKIIAIDTETNNSLDPITCKLMGLCLYTPNEKQAYIPVNHRDYKTGIRFENQLTEKDIAEGLSKVISAKTYSVLHNGKFDYEVLKCTCNVLINIDWDTMIGAKLLDENELSAGLKQQFIEKIDPSQEKYSIDHLFNGVEYADVDPNIFAYYAATDSLMTYKLYLWQKERFDLPENSKLLKLAEVTEMPLVKVIGEMELAGMEVDQNYAALLSTKFHKNLDKVDSQLKIELEKLKDKISMWRLTPEANEKTKKRNGEEGGKSKSEMLEDPINLSSPTQLAILFYDVLKAPTVNKKSPRGTGEEDIKAIDEKLHLPLFQLLLKRRELVKLLTTYIDAIPELAKRWPDGRVRTHFNQYGAATGRLSSSDPLNFQNIPSHAPEIRLLFQAKDGYRIIGADFSAQEPRITAHYSQDKGMIQAYKDGKDLYSYIAAMSFNRKYEDCLEFYPEGTVLDIEGQKVVCGHKTHQNKEGKQYRTYAKSILLGITYGRGAASVGEQIGKSREEAQEIINKFFKAFPGVEEWINNTHKSAYKLGYVEDVAGRRRRLPDIMLPKYEFKELNKDANADFNPFLICKDRVVESKKLKEYEKRVAKCRFRNEYLKIKDEAFKDGIDIKDNTGFIAQAERQAVNSRVQGGAATLTKCALLRIANDKRLKDIGAYLINTVHDEILMEVPEATSKEAEKYLAEDMVESAKTYVDDVPFSCDTYNVNCWYIENYFVLLQSEFKKLLDGGMDKKTAFETECENRPETTRTQLYEIVKEYLGDYIPENVNANYQSFTKVE